MFVMKSLDQNKYNQLEELKNFASDLKPNWKLVETVRGVTRDKENDIINSQGTLAQCCKPGPCSPKW